MTKLDLLPGTEASFYLFCLLSPSWCRLETQIFPASSPNAHKQHVYVTTQKQFIIINLAPGTGGNIHTC